MATPSSPRLSPAVPSGPRLAGLAVVVQAPWTGCAVALPFLSMLLTTPKVSVKLGQGHKTAAQVTGKG